MSIYKYTTAALPVCGRPNTITTKVQQKGIANLAFHLGDKPQYVKAQKMHLQIDVLLHFTSIFVWFAFVFWDVLPFISHNGTDLCESGMGILVAHLENKEMVLLRLDFQISTGKRPLTVDQQQETKLMCLEKNVHSDDSLCTRGGMPTWASWGGWGLSSFSLPNPPVLSEQTLKYSVEMSHGSQIITLKV